MIERGSNGSLDDAISVTLQACSIKFNDAIKSWLGPRYTLGCRLPITLQFETFNPDQRAILKKAQDLPRHIETMTEAFERHLAPEQLADRRYALRAFMILKTATECPGLILWWRS